MADKRIKIEKVTWKEIRERLVTPRGKELMEKLIDHMKHSPTKVWLKLKGENILIVKDSIRGFTLHSSYNEQIFTFRDHRNQEKQIHEDDIEDINGF